MAEKNAYQLEKDLATAKAAHHDLSTSSKSTVGEIRKAADKVEAIQAELSSKYADGAKKHCSTEPIGMKVRAGVYEVACPVCGIRARGDVTEEAVDKFNSGDLWVRDEATEPLGGSATPASESANEGE